jgi:hypothetical protein
MPLARYSPRLILSPVASNFTFLSGRALVANRIVLFSSPSVAHFVKTIIDVAITKNTRRYLNLVKRIPFVLDKN